MHTDQKPQTVADPTSVDPCAHPCATAAQSVPRHGLCSCNYHSSRPRAAARWRSVDEACGHRHQQMSQIRNRRGPGQPWRVRQQRRKSRSLILRVYRRPGIRWTASGQLPKGAGGMGLSHQTGHIPFGHSTRRMLVDKACKAWWDLT